LFLIILPLETVPFHLALVRWKKQQVGIVVEEKHMLEYIRHVEELQIISMIRENSRLYSFDFEFWGGALKILKSRGASKIYQ
jgi:hypothetical protein